MTQDEKRAYHAKWRAANIEKVRASAKEWARKYRLAHPGKNDSQRKWEAANAGRIQNKRILNRYGIDSVRYDEMLAAQGGGCNICGAKKGSGKHRLGIDHDRSCCPGKNSCGKCVRQILCVRCNTGIGHFKDNPALLRKAADVLEKRYWSVIDDIHVTLVSRKGKE